MKFGVYIKRNHILSTNVLSTWQPIDATYVFTEQTVMQICYC